MIEKLFALSFNPQKWHFFYEHRITLKHGRVQCSSFVNKNIFVFPSQTLQLNQLKCHWNMVRSSMTRLKKQIFSFMYLKRSSLIDSDLEPLVFNKHLISYNTVVVFRINGEIIYFPPFKNALKIPSSVHIFPLSLNDFTCCKTHNVFRKPINFANLWNSLALWTDKID